MIISKIENLDHLNELCCDQFIDSTGFNRLVPFDSLAAYVVNSSGYTDLRSFLDSGNNYDDYLSYLQENNVSVDLSDLSIISTFELYAPVAENCSYFFFPYSKKEFISAFYGNVIPTLLESIIELMRSTGRLTQIGGGAGKAIVIKCQYLTETHMSHFAETTDPLQAIDSISSLLKSLSSSFSDKQFYLDYIQHQHDVISKLNITVEELKKQVYSAYQTTWR